jgi:hypothetical protein
MGQREAVMSEVILDAWDGPVTPIHAHTEAQTAAVLEALGREGGEGPRIGYVVAIRNARFATPWLPAGTPLEVTVKAAGSAPPLSIYEVNLGNGLVTGLVSTFIQGT